MKKIYALLFIGFAFSANAQNLVTNGDFEAWTAGVPDFFTVTPNATNGGTVTQETTTIHGGTSSAKFTAPAGTGNVQAAAASIGVVAGGTYNVSYWYNDSSPDARMRHWGIWKDAAGVTIASPVTGFDNLQPSTYNADTTGWQQVTVSVVAPVGAASLIFNLRCYKDVGVSGSLYVDDLVIAGDPLSTQSNTISGLRVFSNNNNLYVISDSSNEKSVVVYDLLGKEVANTVVTDQPINVSNLATGAYIVKVTEGDKTETKKLIIQ